MLCQNQTLNLIQSQNTSHLLLLCYKLLCAVRYLTKEKEQLAFPSLFLAYSCFKSIPTTNFQLEELGDRWAEKLLWLVMLWAGIILLELGRWVKLILSLFFHSTLIIYAHLGQYFICALLLQVMLFPSTRWLPFLILCNFMIPFALLGSLPRKNQNELQLIFCHMWPKSFL